MKQKDDWISKANKEFEEAVERQKNFMETEYKTLSEEDRVDYWSGMIRQQFRWNEESGVDGYAMFSKKSYLLWKEEEPEIDKLLPLIAKKTRLCIDRIHREILT